LRTKHHLNRVSAEKGDTVHKKIQIVPSILTDNPKCLKDMLRTSELFTDFVQIDIMDGIFVPSKSISSIDILEAKTRLKWEAHLMVSNPESYVDCFARAGAQQIIFHYEALESHKLLTDFIHRSGLKAGIAINPNTPIAVLDPLIDIIDSVLFMSVIPGFYGSKFIPEVLNKITAFRKKYPLMHTEIDGGIKENNIAAVVQTGVNSICIGSAIFHQQNPAQSYRRLEQLCIAHC